PTHAAVVASSAFFTRTSPAPMRVMGAPTPAQATGFNPMFVSAVFMSADLTASGVQVGFLPTSNAADPDRTGADAEVPEKVVSPVPVPTCAERMSVPTPPMSGLIAL